MKLLITINMSKRKRPNRQTLATYNILKTSLNETITFIGLMGIGVVFLIIAAFFDYILNFFISKLIHDFSFPIPLFTIFFGILWFIDSVVIIAMKIKLLRRMWQSL
ncbi:MAG: hypothetical protein GPJ54_18555 [Candidatus Heimdallarchaeota archaeon]|nr:hypothetical protein [Candidatus Heimdallarchaeota archaeon]